ncbi:MAG: acyl-CoA dehydrogenase family protein [Dehalococcoidia bacterium]
MEFSFNEEETFREEIRQFLRQEITPEVIKESASGLGHGPHIRSIMRKLGSKGWLAPAWPERYGGLGASYMKRFIIMDELFYSMGTIYHGPHMLYGVQVVGPTLLRYGSEDQKEKYVLPLARGEIDFALGYTEPEAGSDLASLKMKAVKAEDGYLMGGQKVFNTGCHYAEYHWVAARTNPDASKHKGISLFVVDLKSPGITVSPIWIMGRGRTNAVFYDDVWVPKENLVGIEDHGWDYIVTALAFERGVVCGGARRVFHDLLAHCRSAKYHGRPLSERPLIRHRLSQIAVDLEAAYWLCCKVAYDMDQGRVPVANAAMTKLMCTELDQRVAQLGMEILGLYGQLQQDSDYVPLEGFIEASYRDTIRCTIGGGTSEIQRNIIATRGLGLPTA